MSTSRIQYALFASMTLAAAASHASGDMWPGPSYDHDGMVINTRSIELKKGKIWFKLSFVNNTEKTMTIDGDQIQARTPDGRVLSREKGVFERASRTIAIGPHGGNDLNLEYMVGEPAKVSLVLNGVALNAKPARYPDFVAKAPGGESWSLKPYNKMGLRILALEIKQAKESVEAKLNFVNDTEAPVMVDRERITARLPDGSTVPRVKSFFEKSGLITIQPHMAGEVKLEFKVGHPQSLAVLLEGVMIQGGPPPELMLSQQ